MTDITKAFGEYNKGKRPKQKALDKFKNWPKKGSSKQPKTEQELRDYQHKYNKAYNE